MRGKNLCAMLCLTAVLFQVTPGWAAGVPVHEATAEQRQAAQKTFKVGSEHFDARRYEQALKGFHASYDIVQSPNTRLMIARCLRELGRLSEAYAEFTGTVADVKVIAEKDARYAQTVQAAEAELDALTKQVALLNVSLRGAGGETTVTVGDRTVSSNELGKPLVLAPGKVTISAVNAAGERVERSVELTAGAEASMELDLTPVAAPPPPPPPPEPVVEASTSGTPLRTLAYVAGGVGAAGLITFSVFGILNNSKFSDLEDSCPEKRCSGELQDDIDTGKTYQTVANVGLIVGGVGLAAGAVLFLLSTGDQESAGAAQASATQLTLGPGYVGVRGRF